MDYSEKIRTRLMDLYNYYRMESSADPLILFEQLCCVLIKLLPKGSGLSEKLRPSDAVYWYRALVGQFAETELGRSIAPVSPKLEDRPELVVRLLSTAQEIADCVHSGFIFPGPPLFDFLDTILRGQNAKIVYTPPNVAREIVQLLHQRPEPLSAQHILDPACGSGAFLIAAAERAEAEPQSHWVYETGLEQNEELRKCTALLLYFYESGRVFVQVRTADFLSQSGADFYDLILANPPFLSQPLRDQREDRSLPVPTRDSYQAMIQRILQRLAPGGECAIIVPDSFLMNSTRKACRVRQWILETFFCEGVVKLPAQAFSPQASVNASILFLRRPKSEQPRTDDGGHIFFFAVESDGRGGKAKRQSAERNDFEELRQVWPDRDRYRAKWQEGARAENVHQMDTPRRWEHLHFWFGSMEDVQNNDWSLLPEHYRPQDAFEGEFQDPAELLAELQELGQDIMHLIEEMAEAEYEHSRMDAESAE